MTEIAGNIISRMTSLLRKFRIDFSNVVIVDGSKSTPSHGRYHVPFYFHFSSLRHVTDSFREASTISRLISARSRFPRRIRSKTRYLRICYARMKMTFPRRFLILDLTSHPFGRTPTAIFIASPPHSHVSDKRPVINITFSFFSPAFI